MHQAKEDRARLVVRRLQVRLAQCEQIRIARTIGLGEEACRLVHHEQVVILEQNLLSTKRVFRGRRGISWHGVGCGDSVG